MISSLNAIVPMLCVTAAGLAAMVAESFRDPGERMPIAGLGIVGLVGAAVATLLLWNHNVSSFGVVSADNFGLFVTWILIIVGAEAEVVGRDRKSTRLNSSHVSISYAVFCLKKKTTPAATCNHRADYWTSTLHAHP